MAEVVVMPLGVGTGLCGSIARRSTTGSSASSSMHQPVRGANRSHHGSSRAAKTATRYEQHRHQFDEIGRAEADGIVQGQKGAEPVERGTSVMSNCPGYRQA